jgi:hypothetical protein
MTFDERIRKLCEQIQIELDPAKLSQLVNTLCNLLENRHVPSTRNLDGYSQKSDDKPPPAVMRIPNLQSSLIGGPSLTP